MNARPLPAALPHEVAWHQLPPAEVLARLLAAEEGLSEKEAAARFEEAGPNELKEEPRGGPLRILLRQFKILILWILIGAGVVSGMMGDCPETLM